MSALPGITDPAAAPLPLSCPFFLAAAVLHLLSLCPQVASILGLTVQHCPAASSNPRDLCSLLQVSTACRTALRKARGSCIASIEGSADRLTGYAAWLQQHSALVQELHVDVSTRWWKNPADYEVENPSVHPTQPSVKPSHSSATSATSSLSG
jgi:hypothetical protein